MTTYPPIDINIAKVVRLACEIADGHAASLFLVRGDVLIPYIVYNLPQDYVAGIGEVRVGAQCCGRAVESKRPWIVTDMLTDPLFADGVKGAQDSPIRAAFSVPVFQGNVVVASLACHFTAPHTPTALDIDRNEHFAELIAIMLKGRGEVVPHVPVFVQRADATLDPIPA